MNLRSRAASTVVVGIGAVAVAVTGVGIGAAATSHGAPGTARPPAHAKSATKPATFEMYANVDAEADLGSNFDAVSATTLPGSSEYVVTFRKAIGHCAAVVQPGKAGGPDSVDYVESEVVDQGPKSFNITFALPQSDGGIELKHEPFMLTVTCTR